MDGVVLLKVWQNVWPLCVLCCRRCCCCNNQAKENREGTENNLKLRIDPALLIVHTSRGPKGPVPVSLKCKGKEKGDKKKKNNKKKKGKGKTLTQLG